MEVGEVGGNRNACARIPDDRTCVLGFGVERVAHTSGSLKSHAERS